MSPRRSSPPSLSVTATHCPFCALNCGMQYEHDGKEVQNLVRWKKSPLTRGALCAKGVVAHEQVNHEERLRQPLLRVGNDFTEISWDDALDRTAEGLLRIQETHGVAANAVLSGGSLTNEKVYLMGKFARLGLRTPHIDYNGRFCMTSAGAANTMAFGADRMMTPLAELNRAEVVVVIGANISASFPVVLPKLLSGVRSRGGRVIVIDPRAGRFVKDEDLVLSGKPGSDAVVFNGLLREITRTGLTDNKFIRNRTEGFDEAVEAARPWDPGTVEQVADVPANLLREAAEVIGSADRCVYLHGRGPEQQVDGTQNVLSIINVGLACGHVGRPGCGINMLTGQRNGQGGREWGQRCNQLPAGRSISNPQHRQEVADHWGVDPAALPKAGKTYVEILQMAGRGEIRGLLSICTNMSVSSPDLSAVARQLDRLDHFVVIDPFFSQSARHADIVLPGTTFTEEEGTITTIEGRVIHIEQVTAPIPDRTDIDIIRNLARRLGVGDQFEFHQGREVFEEMRVVSAGAPNDHAGMTYDRIKTEGGLFWPCPDEQHPGTPQLYTERFHHENGRARFHPVWPTPRSAALTPTYPLALTTGRVLAQYLSGNQTMRLASLNKTEPGPYVEVHPELAERLSLQEDQPVCVTSAQGESTVGWRPNPKLRIDTVFMPYHWEECNRLVAADLDPTSKIPGFKHTPISLVPGVAESASEVLTDQYSSDRRSQDMGPSDSSRPIGVTSSS